VIKSVAVIVAEGSAAFELGVLCEVFGVDRTDDGVPPFDFRICAEHPGRPLRSTGFSLVPEYGLDAALTADLVAVPAISCTPDSAGAPPAILEILRAAHANGALLLSVCSGVYLLAEAGLLDGLRCTLHWRHAATFRARFPAIKVDEDVLFVDEGQVVTSAGTAAGIDACLHLVRREIGSEVANRIARRMVVAPHRDGGQRQFVDLPVPDTNRENIRPVLDWMLEHLDVEISAAQLARRAAMSERTFARRFVAETGTTPQRWLAIQRVLHARRLLEQTTLSVDEVARESGFGAPALLRHHFHRTVGVTPSDYRRTFACPRPEHLDPA
jgi:transcriptional regulator GlxA family with amidase domain